MSAMPNKKHGGWADDFKKSSGKKTQVENIEKERYITSASSGDSRGLDIPEIDDIQPMDDTAEPPVRANYTKELNVDVLKKNTIDVEDKTTDLTILIEALEPEDEIDEPDDVWQWNQLFTQIVSEMTGQISASADDK